MVLDPGDHDVLTLNCLAMAEHVSGVRRAVVAFAADAGVTEAQQTSIALAVSEAANNVVLHAYREQPAPGRLTVQAWTQDGRFTCMSPTMAWACSPRRQPWCGTRSRGHRRRHRAVHRRQSI